MKTSVMGRPLNGLLENINQLQISYKAGKFVRIVCLFDKLLHPSLY